MVENFDLEKYYESENGYFYIKDFLLENGYLRMSSEERINFLEYITKNLSKETVGKIKFVARINFNKNS